MRKPTLEEVAAAAGVSKMTASRALRGAADVSRESVLKVSRAAEQLGYVGNRLALALSSQRTNLVSVVVPSMSNIVFAEVLAGISAGLEGSGMQAVFGITDYDPLKEHVVIRDMLSWQPAAIIVTGLEHGEETRRLLEQAKIPVIEIMDTDGYPIEFNIGLSHGVAGEEMAHALLGAGRRKFGYVGSALDKDLRAAKRKLGFEKVLKAAGLSFIAQSIAPEFSSAALGKRLTLEMLATTPEPDCIYYSNDDMAAGGLFACMQKGVAVPDQVLIAGFNGLELTAALPVKIATSCSPRRHMGEMAARIACRALTDERATLTRRIVFTPEITLGDHAMPDKQA